MEKFNEVKQELMNKPDIGHIDQTLVGLENANQKLEKLQRDMDGKFDSLTIQLDNMNSLERKVIETNKRQMENCLKHLHEKAADTEQRLQNYQTEGEVNPPTQSVESNLPNLIRQELNERDDSESRKMNLIVTGMREPEVIENAGNLVVSEKDEENFKSMIHPELNISIKELKLVRHYRKEDERQTQDDEGYVRKSKGEKKSISNCQEA